MKNYIYSSPAVSPYTGDVGPTAPRISRGRRASVSPNGGPGMDNPYGDAFDSYNAPSSRMSTQAAPQLQQQQQAPAPMSFDHQQDRINHGNDARAPSNDSTLGRMTRFASNPIMGAVASRMPGNAPYADILNAGMAPQLQQNQMGDINVQNARAMQPFYPQMAQQQVRGATMQNDQSAGMFPLAQGQAQANIGLTNAQAGATTTGAEAGVGQMKALQDQLRAHQTENQQLRAQLQRYQQNEQKQQAVANKPAPAQRPVAVTESENIAAEKVGYGGVMAMRQGKAPGDPTTQPSYQNQQANYRPPQPSDYRTLPGQASDVGNPNSYQPIPNNTGGGNAANYQPQASPATQATGQLHPDGRSGTFGGIAYQLGPDGLMHKVKQPTTQPAQ